MSNNFKPEGERKIVRESDLPGASVAPPPKFVQPKEQVPETRAASVNRERRRRSDTGPMAGLKLHVPDELKEEGFEYRWLNADEARVHAKTRQDDWDVVSAKGIDGSGEGTPVSRIVGKDASGLPRRAILVKKPTDWYRQDKAKELALIAAREKDIKRGVVAEGGLKGQTAYIPDRLADDKFSSDAPGRNTIGD